MNAFLIKPIDPLSLLNAIDAVLAERNGDSEARCSDPAKTVVVNGLALDVNRLKDLEKLGCSPDFLGELIGKHRQDNERIIETMEEASLNCRIEEFRSLADKIKDSAGSLGALTLHRLAANAGKLPAEDFPHSALQLTFEIKNFNLSSCKALQKYLDDRESQSPR